MIVNIFNRCKLPGALLPIALLSIQVQVRTVAGFIMSILLAQLTQNRCIPGIEVRGLSGWYFMALLSSIEGIGNAHGLIGV